MAGVQGTPRLRGTGDTPRKVIAHCWRENRPRLLRLRLLRLRLLRLRLLRLLRLRPLRLLPKGEISYFQSTWWWWNDHTIAVVALVVVSSVGVVVPGVNVVVVPSVGIVVPSIDVVVVSSVSVVVPSVSVVVVRGVIVGGVVRSVVVPGVGASVVRGGVSASCNSGCVDAIIKAAVLGDCNVYGLMVSGCVHLQSGFSGKFGDDEEVPYRAEAVNTSRKADVEFGGKNTIHIRVVQALEEGKELRIGDFGAVEGVDQLDGDMAVL